MSIFTSWVIAAFIVVLIIELMLRIMQATGH